MKNLTSKETKNQLSIHQVAEIEVSYHPHFKASERPKISSSLVCYEILKHNWNNNTIEYKEDFNILLLNRANNVLGIHQISTGGQAGTVVDPKMIFSVALKAGAASIILSHNHPSGNLNPSEQDRSITGRLVECGKLLDINILDHMIVTKNAYFSFLDEGLM
ncbi:DNA repair protein RadC [Pedobacter sp. UYEF25]